MTITYEWKAHQLKVQQETNKDGDVLPNAVCSVKWSKHGVDENGNRGIFGGVTGFSAYEVGLDDFVDFESLTEETVLEWVKSKIVGSYAEHVDQKITAMMQANKIQIKTPPWDPTLAEGIAPPVEVSDD